MGWKDYFSWNVLQSVSTDSEKVIAIDDKMSFDGNIFYYPMTPYQKIFCSDINETDIELVKDEINNNNFEYIFKLLICKRAFPYGYGDLKLLIEVLDYTYLISYDNYLIGLTLLAKANLWNDLLKCISDKNDEKIIDYVAKLFSDKLKDDLKNKNVSSCCKYSPTENKKYDKKFNFSSKISKNLGVSLKNYRNLLSKLKKLYSDKSQSNLLSIISNYKKEKEVSIKFENIYLESLDSFKNNNYLSSSFLYIDSDLYERNEILNNIISVCQYFTQNQMQIQILLQIVI